MTFGLSFTLACVYPLFHCLRLSRRGHVDGVFRHLPGLKHLYRDKVISEWQEINEKMNSARWKYGVISFLGFLREGSDSVCGFQFSVWEQIYGTWIKALVFKNIVYSGIKKNRPLPLLMHFSKSCLLLIHLEDKLVLKTGIGGQLKREGENFHPTLNTCEGIIISLYLPIVNVLRNPPIQSQDR